MGKAKKFPREQDDTELLSAPRNISTKRIFIAATRMNDGKTTTSLALFAALRTRTSKVGFIKPVGQRFIEVDGQQIDEDSVLLDAIFKVDVPIEAMSPISIHPTYTREFLDDPEEKNKIQIDCMCRAFDRAAYEKDYVIIEGTGHAGVGSVFDLSNAQVARRLNAKVIIVASGGIGRPVDEIALNQSLFQQAGVEVIGAIINKVLPDKMEDIQHYCGRALQRMGIPLLGCIPVEEQLGIPSLLQVASELDGQWLNARKANEHNRFERVIIGAMAAKGLVEFLEPGVLIITSGDREDIILSAIAAEGLAKERVIAGLVLTRNVMPHPKLIEMIQETQIPVIICDHESYHVASKINNMTVKTLPYDDDKISIIKRLITENVDLDLIQNAFGAQTESLPAMEI
ncbi:MAG: AAA family ATPase [Verrucomicrobia bacterium]|nr:AAA family ATPase [Verrucomicrobiota bacterium]